MTIIYSGQDLQDENTGRDRDMVAAIRIVGPESIANFKQLVARAMNCWDTAPVELKEFSDIVTEGRILQDYAGMTQFAKKSEPGQ